MGNQLVRSNEAFMVHAASRILPVMQEEAVRNCIKVDACRALVHFDNSTCAGLTRSPASPGFGYATGWVEQIARIVWHMLLFRRGAGAVCL